MISRNLAPGYTSRSSGLRAASKHGAGAALCLWALVSLSCSFEEIYLVRSGDEPAASGAEVAAPPRGNGEEVDENTSPAASDGEPAAEPLVPASSLSEEPVWPRLGGLAPQQLPADALAEEPLPPPSSRCSAVDFLFVIDNSASMEAQQATLAAAFPDFIGKMEAATATNDFHVMTIDTDDVSLLDRLDGFFGSEPCDRQLGAGRRTSGVGVDCGLLGDQRYLVAAQPGREAAFSCIASVGDQGELAERPMDATLTALSLDFNAESGCNAGFSRQDSLLVVTLLTDEDDESSAGDPADWQQELLALKSPEQLVVLGLVSQEDGAGCGFESSERLSSFVQRLPNGVVGDACDADYSASFDQVIERVSALCAE